MNISDINTYDSDFLLKIRLICERRGVKLKQVESVAMSMLLNFGLANLTPLLPASTNVFYVIKDLTYSVIVTQVTQAIILRCTNFGGGSMGNFDIRTFVGNETPRDIAFFLECDSMLYVVNGNTGGSLSLYGQVFKITTA